MELGFFENKNSYYTCLLFPQVPDPLLEVVRLLLLLRLLLVGGESSLDLVERGPLDLHGHAEVPLVLAAVDVVEVVDGVLDDAVACLAVIPVAWQRRGKCVNTPSITL